jgi:ankyrin repeat protein
MDVAGLVIGVAGLFSVCLDILERVDSYQDAKIGSSQLSARFKADKLRLREWAKGVGIEDGKLKESHNPRLDNSEILSTVQNILQSISDIFPKFPKHKITWVVTESRLTKQVEWLESLIDKLYDIIPTIDRKAICEWLGITRIDDQYERNLSLCLGGTCDWIFKKPEFQNWTGILWLYGPAGHGKTILAAKIISCLRERYEVHHFFCSSHVQSGGNPEGIIRYWVSNMDVVVTSDNKIATTFEVWEAFRKYKKGIFVIDGFDEYPDRSGFLQTLKDNIGDTQILITSRDEVDIRSDLLDAIHIPIKNENDEDVRLFSKNIVDKKLGKKEGSFREELANQLADRCEGMFLWIKLQEMSLRGGLSKAQLHRVVNQVPEGLDSTYDRNWRAIQNRPKYERERAISILRWAMFSFRPLTVLELTHALLVDLDDLPDAIDEEYVDGEIKDLCGSLIEIQIQEPFESSTLHLVHVSAKEYLISVLPYDSPPEQFHNLELVKICVEKFKGPFSQYSLNFWWRHVEFVKDVPPELMNRVFDPGNTMFDMLIFSLERECRRRYGQNEIAEYSSRLCYAALLGLVQTMIFLGPSQMNHTGGVLGTALQAVCVSNSNDCFQLLIKWGADVTIKAGFFGSALHCACWYGRKEMIERLIEVGADVCLEIEAICSPLHVAVTRCGREIVELLIDKGADLNPKSLVPPLVFGAANGADENTQLLLDRGADVNLKYEDQGDALLAASAYGHLSTVQLLLMYGASRINLALRVASFQGHSDIVELLLDHRADPDFMDDGTTSLMLATSKCRVRIIELLLKKGASIDKTNDEGSTALHLAIKSGYLLIIEMLLKYGADIESPNLLGYTPLMIAIECFNTEIAKYLIKQGANINAQNSDGFTPLMLATEYKSNIVELLEYGSDVSKALHVAAFHGHTDLVERFLKLGAEVDSRSIEGYTALHLAAVQRRFLVARILLDSGADPNMGGKHGYTPLHYAAINNDIALAILLLNRGAESSPDDTSKTPLLLASRGGSVELTKLLIRKEIEVDIDGKNALHLATQNGQVQLLEYLLDVGFDPKVKDARGNTLIHYAYMSNSTMLRRVLELVPIETSYWSPLHWACKRGDFELVKMLSGVEANPVEAMGVLWNPLDIAIYHQNSYLVTNDGRLLWHLPWELVNLADESLVPKRKNDLVSPAPTGYTCDACECEILGPRYHCKSCVDYDYCFMCQIGSEKLHSGHEWEVIAEIDKH